MKTTYKLSLFLLALCVTSVTFWACNRTVKKDEVLGNMELKSAPADFVGIVGSTPTPDFVQTRIGNDLPQAFNGNLIDETSMQIRFTRSASVLANRDYIYITNTFSHEVTWFVTFKGQTSGATKTYTGTSQTIDKTSFTWDGRNEGRFFMDGETVEYTLSFLGSSIKYTGLLTISGIEGVGSLNYGLVKRTLPNGDILKYSLIDDFDGSGSKIQTSYSDAADGTGKAVFYVADNIQRSGFFSYYMKATDNNGNGYTGGASGEALTELNKLTNVTDPSKIYFNAYIYGFGRANTSVFFQAFENDFADPTINSFPTRDVTMNDMYYTIIEVNWTGWKLVSVPYTSFKPANNPASGGGGNRIQEPHKLCGFGIELDSYPTPGMTVEAAIDDVYLSEYGPFQP